MEKRQLLCRVVEEEIYDDFFLLFIYDLQMGIGCCKKESQDFVVLVNITVWMIFIDAN